MCSVVIPKHEMTESRGAEICMALKLDNMRGGIDLLDVCKNVRIALIMTA